MIPDIVTHKWAGYTRDFESSLDYLGFRHYNYSLYRLLQLDEIGGSSNDPQSWNAYAYGRDNPINSIDILGLITPKGYMSCGQTNSLTCESTSLENDSYDFEAEILKQHRESVQELNEIIFSPITNVILNVQDSPLAYTLRGEYLIALQKFMENVNEGMRPENLALMSSGLKMEGGFKPVLIEGKWVNFAIEEHHLLPKDFRELFEKVGLNIEDYKIPLDKLTHRLKLKGDPYGLHTGPENWNKQWKIFFDKYPSFTKQQVLQQLKKMRKAEGI